MCLAFRIQSGVLFVFLRNIRLNICNVGLEIMQYGLKIRLFY
jgi:hypothetical protein